MCSSSAAKTHSKALVAAERGRALACVYKVGSKTTDDEVKGMAAEGQEED